MKHLLRSFTALGLLFALGSQAHGPAVARYHVNEVPVPHSVRAGCRDDYVVRATNGHINDFSIVNGNFDCYTVADPATGTFQLRTATFVAANWFGALELSRPPDPGTSFGDSINNRGEVFGFEIADGVFAGARWTLGGGHERLFFDPACEFIQVSSASDGNGRYIVGWGLRGDSRLPPPLDALCLRLRWLIRAPDGVETPGPLDGSPTDINALNVAVGSSDRSAIRYHVPTGQVRVLHAADATHSAEAYDINDLGEVAGRITQTISPPGSTLQCDPGVAVRWDRDGREHALPHLPGAVSSHAFGIGYEGETVGDSGAGNYCPYTDYREERAALWSGGRAFDLNLLIPRSAGITLTQALSVNRRGQITAGGFENDEPLTQCPSSEFDAVTGTVTYTVIPCHHTRMYVLTPVGR